VQAVAKTLVAITLYFQTLHLLAVVAVVDMQDQAEALLAVQVAAQDLTVANR
jgi:hypothetical protein